MAGGFSSLNTALSALRYTRVAMDVASDNIANVTTDGFTRRRVESAEVAAGVAPAMWFRAVGSGDGVAVTGIDRVTDELLNARVRREHGNQGSLDVQSVALARFEDGLGEPGGSGLAAALTEFQGSWNGLAQQPTGSAARVGVLATANSVVDAVRAQLRNLEGESGQQRSTALVDVAEATTLVEDLAQLNRALVAGQANGSDVNALRDSRDQITVRLSQLTGASAQVQPDGAALVTLGGAVLVEGSRSGTLTLTSGVTPTGGSDGAPLTFAVTDPSGATSVVTPGGELGGVAQLLNVTLAGYAEDLGEVVRQVADAVNTQHAAGYDAAGAPGAALFAYDPADVLGSLAVAITDPAGLAASSVAGGGSDGGNADALFELPGLGEGYRALVTGFGTAVAEISRQTGNQRVLTNQVDAARDRLGGVDLDEEVVNLTVLQRQYEAAARVMSTVDSMLDTLINRTGLVR